MFRSLARIESICDVIWGDENESFKEGQSLESESICFESGIVQLRMENDVRIAIKGPADFRLNAPRNAFCAEGEVSVTVPPQGKGFEIATPLLSVIDLGTKFLVDVAPNAVQVHTISGRTELIRLSENKIRLSTGEAFQKNTAGMSKRFPVEPGRFLTEIFVTALKDARDENELSRWRTVFGQWSLDPGLLVFFDFEDDAATLVNRGNEKNGNATLSKSTACRGRWKGKTARNFNGKKSFALFDTTATPNSMTLWTSVCLSPTNQYNRVILGSRQRSSGCFTWQILADGSVQLAVDPPANKPTVLYRTGSQGQSILSGPSPYGVWGALGTRDGGETTTGL